MCLRRRASLTRSGLSDAGLVALAYASTVLVASTGRSRSLRTPLLGHLAAMVDPSRFVTTVRVTVGPVYEPALFVPLVFAFEGGCIAYLQRANPRGDIDAVDDKKSLPGSQGARRSLSYQSKATTMNG